MQTCETCRHWDVSEWCTSDPPDEDDLGDCRALDPATIPYAWRLAPREVMATKRTDGKGCPCWASRETPATET